MEIIWGVLTTVLFVSGAIGGFYVGAYFGKLEIWRAAASRNLGSWQAGDDNLLSFRWACDPPPPPRKKATLEAPPIVTGPVAIKTNPISH